ncbi:MAG TPA: glycosyltransferase [Bryobacteraceae bacterium]|nr:glycosyltransferase [Bryobacteraceae bacterium]
MISLVIISRNEGAELEATVRNLVETAHPEEPEIVVVDDGSTDGSTAFLSEFPNVRVLRSEGIGVANARNLGACHARGAIIVFSDAHIRAPKDWPGPIVEALERSETGACAPGISSLTEPRRRGFGLYFAGPELHARWRPKTSKAPEPAPILPGCFLAMRRDVFEATGGFDAGMRQLGGNDNELSFRLWTLGYRLLVLPQLEVAHLFRTSVPYEATWAAVVHNRLRMAFVHFSRERRERVIGALRHYEAFPAGLSMAVESDLRGRRSLVERSRKFDDDWFFRNFNLEC